MPIRRLTIDPIHIPFRQTFSHAAASRAQTEAVLVCAEGEEGLAGCGEGCPRSYVTGETLAGAQQWFHRHEQAWRNLSSVDDLRVWVARHEAEIDQHPAMWCAVETACLDLFGREAGRPIEEVVGTSRLQGSSRYSAVLGTDSLAAFENQFKRYRGLDFTDYKVKVTGNLAEDILKCEQLTAAGIPDLCVRLDANNLWKDESEACTYLRALRVPLMGVEEPLRVGDYEGCRKLSGELGVPIILDESFLRVGQFVAIQDEPATWVINVRVSKMGGVLRSLAVAERAKALGIPIIVGAQVGETSILTRAALTVANAYRDILVAQEGAFGTYLLERDICHPTLMFGKEGRLATDSFRSAPGMGLTVAT